MLQENDKIVLLIFSIMLLVPLAMVALFVIFTNKKNQLLQKQAERERRFQKELAGSQVEIREETLRNISWELHDNIGQLLTLAKIYVQNAGQDQKKLEESTEILSHALDEVRALSKSINPEYIKKLGLLEASQQELKRFERLRFLQTDFQVHGEPFFLSDTDETILFRILQEFFSNTIKHARAKKIELHFYFDQTNLKIECFDDGIGFNDQNSFNGLGLKNMELRAEMVGADLSLQSNLNSGTQLIIQKEFQHEK